MYVACLLSFVQKMELSPHLDIVDHIGKRDFNQNYFKLQKPVIIKGLTAGTFAGENWSVDYFRKTMGEIEIDVYDNANPKADASALTSPDLKMRFKDYLDIISKDEHTDLRIFLCNLFKYNPGLKKEFPCPDIFKGLLEDVGFMFFGGKGTTVRIHYDIDMSGVLHTHFGGRKRVVMIAPQYGDLLYRMPFNTYSLVDLDNPDYAKYPGLRFVKGYDVVLDHGDSIFMPPGYWHYMTYLEGSFSVSYRKISGNLKYPLEGLIHLCLQMPLDKVLSKVLGESWLKAKTKSAQKKADRYLEKLYFDDFKQPLGI